MASNYDWEPHREVVTEGQNILERTSASIVRSNQIAIETEQIGTEVLSDLGSQREALLRSQRRIQETNDDLSKTRIVIRAIRTNVLYNKAILITIILLEICILGGIIYIKIRK